MKFELHLLMVFMTERIPTIYFIFVFEEFSVFLESDFCFFWFTQHISNNCLYGNFGIFPQN